MVRLNGERWNCRLLIAGAALLLGAAPLAGQDRSDLPNAPRRVDGGPSGNAQKRADHSPTGATFDDNGNVASPPSKAASALNNLLTPPVPADVTLSKDGRTIYVIGIMGEGTYLRFAKLARGAKGLQRVYLGSVGGLTIEGRLLGALVRNRKLDTYVEGVCASACTQVFAAGRTRVLGARGKLGFHQASFVLKDGSTLNENELVAGYSYTDATRNTEVIGVGGNGMMRLAYRLAGFAPAFIDKAMATPFGTMWYPTDAELTAGLVITRKAALPEVEGPFGADRSPEAVRTMLDKLPLWTALARARPSIFDEFALDIWRSANSGLSLDAAIDAGRDHMLDEVEKDLARAPDMLLDRYLSHYREFAEFERSRDYADCSDGVSFMPRNNDKELAAFNQRNDILAAELIGITNWVVPPSEEDARKQFNNAALKGILRMVDLSPSDESNNRRDCRVGLQTFETIARLDTRQRIKAFRALLALTRIRADREAAEATSKAKLVDSQPPAAPTPAPVNAPTAASKSGPIT